MAQLSLSEKCVLFAKLSLLVFLVLATLVESEEWRRRATDGERERGNSSRSASLDEVIHALGTLVTKSQVLKPTKLDFPFSLARQFGVFPSNIRVNSVGGPDATIVRRSLSLFDNNAFVTLWVSSILLEVARFTDNPVPSDSVLNAALDAISSYHDKNYPLQDGILSFWSENFNASAGMWYCESQNLTPVADDTEKFLDVLHTILDDLGLASLWNRLPSELENLKDEMDAFGIPADFDDTGVNLGFGTLLKNYTSIYEEPFQRWWSNNTDFHKVLQALKLYAYRPLSKNSDTNTIDPRTYFYMREYLEWLRMENLPAAFVPTWIHNVSSSIHNTLVNHVNYKMPFYVNNIDLTVSTNTIYGIVSATLAGLGNVSEWFDDDIQMILSNTTDLIAWSIDGNFSNRPDLALTYYPSVYNFYWFTSRILNLLTSKDSLPYPVLSSMRDRLASAMRGNATMHILKAAVWEGDYAYFDDFLGDGDTDFFGKPVVYGEDRICTTAMAVNALLYTWTERGKLLPSTPSEVVEVVRAAADWLKENSLTGKFRPLNAVFSGSVKSIEQLPFAFPANVLRYLNGTTVPPGGNVTIGTVIGMNGVIPKETYDQMLRQKHFGLYTPLDFHGFNVPSLVGAPFWSSESFTYASAMLALVQYKALFIA